LNSIAYKCFIVVPFV